MLSIYYKPIIKKLLEEHYEYYNNSSPTITLKIRNINYSIPIYYLSEHKRKERFCYA